MAQPNPLNLTIEINGAGVLGDRPRRAMQDGLKKYGSSVFASARHFEQIDRETGVPEFTSTHIKDAIRAQQRPVRRSIPRRLLGIGLRLAVFALATVTGVAGNNFPDPTAITWFVGTLIAGLFVLGISEAMEWSR